MIIMEDVCTICEAAEILGWLIICGLVVNGVLR